MRAIIKLEDGSFKSTPDAAFYIDMIHDQKLQAPMTLRDGLGRPIARYIDRTWRLEGDEQDREVTSILLRDE